MELQAVEQVPRVADLDRADCRRRAEQHFSAAAMTAGYVAVYDKLTVGAASRKHIHHCKHPIRTGSAGKPVGLSIRATELHFSL